MNTMALIEALKEENYYHDRGVDGFNHNDMLYFSKNGAEERYHIRVSTLKPHEFFAKDVPIEVLEIILEFLNTPIPERITGGKFRIFQPPAFAEDEQRFLVPKDSDNYHLVNLSTESSYDASVFTYEEFVAMPSDIHDALESGQLMICEPGYEPIFI